MSREKVLAKISQAWGAFQSSYTGLSSEQITQPGVSGHWSIKDILAHVTSWEQQALEHLPTILQGGRPPKYSTLYGGIDAFNAQMTARAQKLGLSEVMTEFETTHLRLMEYLQGIPGEQFSSGTRFFRRVRLDTYGHYPNHTQAIRDWRERNE